MIPRPGLDSGMPSVPVHGTVHARVCLIVLGAIVAVSLFVYPQLLYSTHKGSPDLHATIEMAGAIMGLIAGVALAAQFIALGCRFHLLVGLAFFANGAEDLVHGALDFCAHHAWTGMSGRDLNRFIPGTYVTGRLMLSMLLLWAPCFLGSLAAESRRKREMVLFSISAAILMTAITLAAFRVPLPKFIYPEHLISRPVDFLCALLLLAGLAAFLRQYGRTREPLIWWLTLSIVVNVLGQITMSFSKGLYDAFFDMAHVYKVAGYSIPILGFSLCQIRIIAQREQAEAAMRQARDAAAEASRCKSEFLANMSHEIRTPMTAILGFAETLADNVEDPENVEAIRIIRRNGEHLLGLINDILDLSKIEAEKMTTEQVACSPHEIVAEVASLVRVRTEAKKLAFHTEFIGPVPETIRTDPLRLRQILINLLGNAIKFTETGGVRLLVRLVAEEGQARMQFDVIDTGTGMTAEQAERIFQPFSQADTSTSRQFGGTGLGLTISKRLAQLLGGDVLLVESQAGLGTRFRATVATGPLDGVRMIEGDWNEKAVTVRREAATASAPPADPAKALDGLRILLAEDGPDNQRLIAHVLKKAGADVTIVENGKLAADAALAARDEGTPFDVILMDMQMPVLDGYAATRRLRERGYRGRIIALTANAMAGDRDRCTQAGCDDYLTKPIDRRKLVEGIGGLLCQAGASR